VSDAARRDPRPEILLDARPWGRFEVLSHNEVSTVKIITVLPGQRLSLQRHQWRDEMWVLLDGDLVVEVGSDERVAGAGERIWIPRRTLHRVTNKGDLPSRFVEVAFGHFDENDIERISDDYDRS
jgi:mannose-6-phosphate isomerase-like protein (cupin superfamily)